MKRILILDEYSPNQKCILNGASRSGVECLALQHGGMHDLHPGYVYGVEDKELNIFPDHFLTWGSGFTDFLLKSNWPKDVSEVGHLRTDIIPQLTRKSGSKMKKIMFASQPHKDENYTENTAKLVFRAFATFDKKVQVYMRPHPLERDIGKYRKWAEEVGYTNLDMDTDSDLYVALCDTDIVITAFSTVGQEAIYFNIPLITVDYLNRDIAHYVQEGVAQNAATTEELLMILKNKLEASNIETKSNEEYIKKHAHKIDGRVSERILKKLLSE
ncbi:CDP-glycerol glycerophosphotransferase family protein [Ekhidna sp.]|uniref:CDP-glycerol glycerophosphotransferase family protein n=1 Tax=Ekhidna sp. TaxID=2608089 RepID=UPI00329A6E1E